jgi:hypothetical protein
MNKLIYEKVKFRKLLFNLLPQPLSWGQMIIRPYFGFSRLQNKDREVFEVWRTTSQICSFPQIVGP